MRALALYRHPFRKAKGRCEPPVIARFGDATDGTRNFVGWIALAAQLEFGNFREVGMIRNLLYVTTTIMALASGPLMAQTADDPTVAACKATGLLALQGRSPDITDLVMDMETLAVTSAQTIVEDVPVTAVVLGEAYIVRNEQSGKPDRFVCLVGEKGKVLLTFFTAK